MQPAAYFAPIRQIWSRATYTRSDYQVEALFIIFPVSTAKKSCRYGTRIWESSGIPTRVVKARISQQQYCYWYPNYMKIKYCATRNKRAAFVFATFCTIMRTPT
jgi:hypothetical protein